MIKVVPSIIPQRKEDIIEGIDLVVPFASLVQIDICDGEFTKNKTWPYNGQDIDFFDDLKTQKVGWPRWEKVDTEIHLMVAKPEDVLKDWIDSGISSVVVQIEATEKMQSIIDMCKEFDVALFIALKPSTDIARVMPFLSQVAGVQCMGSDKLGSHGVELDERAVEQLKKLKEIGGESILAIDIGVNLETKDMLVEAGAHKLICGSSIFDAENPEDAYYELSETDI